MSTPSTPSSPRAPGLQTNMDVDYVLSYRFGKNGKAQAVEKFQKLIQALSSVGLATEVRDGEDDTILVFVRVASDEHLFGEVYRSRVRDWLHGVRAAAPPKETKEALEGEPLYEAERLRIIYQLITNPQAEGGAGITPNEDGWKEVEAVFALHDHAYNKDWLKKWSKSYFLKPEDLDEIRNHLGEKIAFYFAFTQSYFTFLMFPAGFGFFSWLFLGHFSSVYGFVIALWCTVFSEYWRHQEVDLGVRWGVRGVSNIEQNRRDFKHEKEITDPVTGERVHFFPSSKRLRRQLLAVPFAALAALLLGTLIATCFGIEIFIAEVYNGPLKTVLVFLPTGILTTAMPILTAILTSIATKLTEFENYKTQGAHDTALTRKIFVLNFITSYLPILLTAFVYVPFGTLIVPYLDVFSLTVKPFAQDEKQMTTPDTGFTINPDRLRKQVIYFTVTAQIVNMAMEIVVPYLKRRGLLKYKEMQTERSKKNGGTPFNVSEHDAPEEKAFLARVRSEATLDVYDVTQDLREMVLQFGYLALFSVIWPLCGVSFLINDWFELRTDAFKIAVEMQRPTPWRADTIGSWLDNLSFLTWLGSITGSALVYLFSNDGFGPDGTPFSIKGWGLLLSIIFSEHLFFTMRWGVRIAISKIDSPGLQKERRERFQVRKQFFEESFGEIMKNKKDMGEASEVINRETLEEEQRRASLHDASPEETFWGRQRGWRETVVIGEKLIENGLERKKQETAQKVESKKEL